LRKANRPHRDTNNHNNNSSQANKQAQPASPQQTDTKHNDPPPTTSSTQKQTKQTTNQTFDKSRGYLAVLSSCCCCSCAKKESPPICVCSLDCRLLSGVEISACCLSETLSNNRDTRRSHPGSRIADISCWCHSVDIELSNEASIPILSRFSHPVILRSN
jgi:hypothetical protein